MADDSIPLSKKIWGKGNPHKLALEAQIVSERLVAEVGVRAGQKVLDLACGSGNTAIAAARRRARVTATDIVPELIEVARARAEAEQLEDIEFRVENSSPVIPLPDAAFDVSLSTFGLNFFPHLQSAIDEVLRVTRPGGMIGITLWADASLPSDFFRATQRIRNHNAAEGDNDEHGNNLGNGEYLRKALRGRASSVRILPGSYECCYTSWDDYLDRNLKYHPPIVALWASATPEQRDQYRNALQRLAMNYNRAVDGTLAVCLDYLSVIIVKA